MKTTRCQRQMGRGGRLPGLFLSLLLQLPALFAATPAENTPAPREPGASTPPNIVFIFSDDHAWQAISAYGSNLIQTPNIDRIAREGMRFDRCLVPNSICGPSRATVLTGTYNHINGFIDNSEGSTFDGSQTTFPKLLQRANYQTAMIGKWHLESDPTGFDYWQILPGQGVYYNPPMIRNGEKIREPGYVTDIITERSLEWLKQRDPSRPFLLMCQHKAPHRNWFPNVTELNRDRDRLYPEPPTLFDDYAGRGKGEHEQDMSIAKTMHDGDVKLRSPRGLTPEQLAAWNAYYEPRNEAFRKANLQGDDLVRWKYQRYLHDYLACIASVDEGVGKVLDYLKENGLEENTIVVYASDQGFYLGEHGWFDKRWIFEESARTPFVMRWPGKIKPGSTTKALVSNLDFAETLLEAAHLPVPAEMQGRSLLPLFSGQTPPDWRKSFYYHYYEHPGVHNVPRHYGVVTDRYKLVHFYEPDFNYWELFDLEKDPQEMKSVFDQPAYAAVRRELEAELKRLRLELKVPERDPKSNSGTVIPAGKAFVHPGVLHNREELAFVKQQIAGGIEPWKTGWDRLSTSKMAALDYVPRPRAEVVRGPYNNPNIGSSEMSADAAAAYTQALAWSLTGNQTYARNAVAILNAWSATLKTVSGHDTKLLIGMTGVQFCAAAELMRHTYDGWQRTEQARFERWLQEVLYPPIEDFNPRANGNWDASMIQTMLAMGIFLDDRPMFERAVNYFLHGEGNGSIQKYFNSFGECQESGRDQGHTQMGLGFLGCAAEIAWKQGVDLYGAADNRLALGFEYTAKYNLGHDVPYETYHSFEDKYVNPDISPKSRGNFAPIYERIVYHYHGRLGMDLPYSREVVAKTEEPGRGGAHVPWGSLMFAGLPRTIVSIQGGNFLLNGVPTYQGRSWQGSPVEGLLMNSRMVQGIFDDLNPETAGRWKYEDTQLWDPNRNTDEFVKAMDSWYAQGLLAITINLQGGSPLGYGNKGWINSAFDPKGELRPAYLARLERILNRADAIGMVVILGLFYNDQDQHLENEAAVINAVDHTIDWLFAKKYRNVLIEVNNECNLKYDHDILKPDRVHEVIERIKSKVQNGYRYLAGTSFSGGRIPPANVVGASDFLLIHGNGVKDPAMITDMVAKTRAVPGYRPMPILFNEDDHFDFAQPTNNLVAAVKAHASWGYFDYRMKNENYDDGFQSVPVNWTISSPRKKAFFNKLKEITGGGNQLLAGR